MPEAFHPLDILRRKRDGLSLTTDEIDSLVSAVVSGQMSDAQIAAFLMATFLRGLNSDELTALTQAMRLSGEVLDPSPLGSFLVDKHSTGGVGDKTSLLIAPILAAAGLAAPTTAGVPGICVPMISGRSLGHTGGTLDKLETIPGFNTQLSLPRMLEVLRTCGAALAGQTPNLVPADRILYALRDHTSTVESPFLICASIMSKKLAEGLDALVLDVKTGSGAFLRSDDEARHLARLMVDTGEAAGTRTVALLTSMDQPLGRFAGNWVEVWECADILRGQPHPISADLIELSLHLSGHMLHLAGAAATPEAGATLAADLLRSGKAYHSWLQIVKAQGGDTDVFNHPAAFHKPAAKHTLTAAASGYLASMNCTEVGWAVQRLGASRTRPGDPVSAHAGIEMHAKLCDRIEAGQPLVTLFTEEEILLDEPVQMLRNTLEIRPSPPARIPLLREILTRENLSGHPA